MCYSPWGCKELDMTEQLNCTDLIKPTVLAEGGEEYSLRNMSMVFAIIKVKSLAGIQGTRTYPSAVEKENSSHYSSLCLPILTKGM